MRILHIRYGSNSRKYPVSEIKKYNVNYFIVIQYFRGCTIKYTLKFSSIKIEGGLLVDLITNN